MHLFHIPQCTIQNRNVHISVLYGTLLDMGQVHCGICEIGPFLFWFVLPSLHHSAQYIPIVYDLIIISSPGAEAGMVCDNQVNTMIDCWCPGSLRRRPISSHAIDYARQVLSSTWNYFKYMSCQISNISCTKSQNLNVSCLILQCNILKPGVKLRMKM